MRTRGTDRPGKRGSNRKKPDTAKPLGKQAHGWAVTASNASSLIPNCFFWILSTDTEKQPKVGCPLLIRHTLVFGKHNHLLFLPGPVTDTGFHSDAWAVVPCCCCPVYPAWAGGWGLCWPGLSTPGWRSMSGQLFQELPEF